VPGGAVPAFDGLVDVSVGAATHCGHHRRVNEDSLLVLRHVYVVADGMGGHAAGDKASAILVEEMRRLAEGAVEAGDVSEVLELANARVRTLADGGAGTTVTAAIGVEHEGAPYWLVTNLGDSRTYRLSEGRLEQVSVDHSVVQELIDRGLLDAAAARRHPQRHVITRAVGSPEILRPDFWLLPAVDGDRLVLCSDGLTGEVEDDRIEETLLEHPDPQRAADALVTQALDNGGHDNVTVIVIDTRSRRAPSADEHMRPRPGAGSA
jgi:serine/threonine protein phosphatase PrpC